MGIIYISIIIISFIVMFIMINSKTLQRKAHEATISAQNKYKDYMEYNEKEQELVVNKRSPYFKTSLCIKPHMENNYGYKEEKYVYTGATVGGITTGGVDKTGGNYFKQEKTSKVQFMFYFYDPEKKNNLYNIKKIRLNNKELIEKAEKSSISKYLKNDCIIVEEEITQERLNSLNSALLAAADTGNINMARNINAYITTESLPEKEKCDTIINWLSDCD